MTIVQNKIAHCFQTINEIDKTENFKSKEECVETLLERIKDKKTLLLKDTILVKKAMRELLDDYKKLKGGSND